MKNALATWIDDDPKHNPKTLFKMLKASIGQERFGGMPCPTLKQVQHAVHYMRSKDILQKSTVPAAIEELMKWRLTDNVEDQVAHKPFVFGVEEEAGRFTLGDGGMQAFRVGLSTVELLRKYHAVVTANPMKTVICHMDTTFSTNVLGYPMFVFGYSDMAGSFHLLCVCITSQRTHADVAWLLRSLKEKFTSLLNYAWAPTRLMGDADKAQFLGMTNALQPELPLLEYLMCFFHCYDKRQGMTSEEWTSVTFDIYLLHMSTSEADLVNNMDTAHANWEGSRTLRKFRTYFFNTWLPYHAVYSTNRGPRFWKWQVFHSHRGCSYTNNPNEHFNRKLKDAIGRVKKHVPHLVQEVAKLVQEISTEATPWVQHPVQTERMKKYFKKLLASRRLRVNEVPRVRPVTWRVLHLPEEIAEGEQDEDIPRRAWHYNSVSRNVQRLESHNQPDIGDRPRASSLIEML
ncbi:hypothetical protein DYB37_011773 [Aphanomyces astaci]|uniref:MULE transposase domain-containing protein n=2 Tax=Aphanomyces astaci TaxID=112090 RepID=A0A397AY18_APHAT|nr:hypothetical protein DYB25_007547 [Aphanomyces astaci]RHZ30321.1 hypothetical protein DYB37_011773 [Aphanomyces astaci]